MFKKNKKENEVVRMEESTFLKRHAGKILLAGGAIVAVGAYYLLNKHDIEMKDALSIQQEQIEDLFKGHTVIKKITDREKSRVLFEIKTLEQYIRDLNPEININKFVNIPNAEERIVQLYTELEQIELDSICLDKYAK